MARERWFADGFEITEGFTRDLETYEGLFGAAPVNTTDIAVPLRDGEIPVPGRLGPTGFTLRMWMLSENRTDVMMQWEQLLRVLLKRHRLVHWVQHRVDGTIRETWGRVVGKVDPTQIGRRGYRAQIEVQVPSGTWQNTQEVDTGAIKLLIGTTPGPIDRLIELPGFAGASAPLTKLRYNITGTVEGLKVTCPETGEWFKYDIPLVQGDFLHVNAETDVVTAPRVDAFRYKGPYMMEAIPSDNINAKPVLRVEATQAGLGATIRVRGRRLYLI